MKTIKILLILSLIGCSHRREGDVVKGSDGKIYKLKAVSINEAYTLEEIDTTEILNLLKNKPKAQASEASKAE